MTYSSKGQVLNLPLPVGVGVRRGQGHDRLSVVLNDFAAGFVIL